LGHDVVAVADEVQDRRPERSAVERDRFGRILNPELRLDTRHRGSFRRGVARVKQVEGFRMPV
jgi:hypothetical protein